MLGRRTSIFRDCPEKKKDEEEFRGHNDPS